MCKHVCNIYPMHVCNAWVHMYVCAMHMLGMWHVCNATLNGWPLQAGLTQANGGRDQRVVVAEVGLE